MWQLYLFAVTNLLPIVFPFVTTWMCNLFSAKDSCNNVEQFMLVMLGYCMVYVGLFSLVLIRINQDEAAKLKRLALVLTNCAAITLSGIVMLGNANLGGFETSWCHWGDMIWVFLLLVVLMGATANDDPVAGTVDDGVLAGMGVNCKTFLVLIEVIVLAKMFAFTDVMTMDSFLEDPGQMTDLAHVLLRLTALLMLEILLILWFALAYGNGKDHEGLVVSTVAMMILALFYLMPVSAAFKHGMLWSMGLPSVIVFVILAVVAVVAGRKQRGTTGERSPLLG